MIRGLMEWIRRKLRRRRRKEIGRNPSDDAQFPEEVDPCIEANGAAAPTDWSNTDVCHTPVMQSARGPTAPELEHHLQSGAPQRPCHPNIKWNKEEFSGLSIGCNGNGGAVARPSDSDTLMSTEDNVTEEFSGQSIGCNGNSNVKAVAYLSDSDTLMSTEEELTEQATEEDERTEYSRQLLAGKGQKTGYQHHPDSVTSTAAVENYSSIAVEDQQSPGGGRKDDLSNGEKSFSQLGSEDNERVDRMEFAIRSGENMPNGGGTVPRGGNQDNGRGSDNAPNRGYRLPQEANQVYGRVDVMANREDPAQQGASQGDGRGSDGMPNRGDPAIKGAIQGDGRGSDGMPNRGDPVIQGANQGDGRGSDGMPNRGDPAIQGANQGDGRGSDGMPNRGDPAIQGANQGDGRGSDGMPNREDPAQQGASQSNGRGGDNAPERGKAVLKGAIPRVLVEIQVNLENCRHLITEVNYNDMDEFCVELDKKDITELMSKLLEVDEFERIWSSCHGGCDPPMNFLLQLDAQNCTLGDLQGYVQKELSKKKVSNSNQDGSKQPSEDGDLMKLLGSYKDYSGKRLRDLGCSALYDISKLIRVKPFPQRRPLWKRLASHAGLKKNSIDALDTPETGGNDSLAMAFLQRINTSCPEEKVAWLAMGLVAIGRKDLLTNENFGIFKECISSGCIGERET